MPSVRGIDKISWKGNLEAWWKMELELWVRAKPEKVWLIMFERESVSCPSCLTFCDPTDCSPLDSCVHGILQTRILELPLGQWVASPFSRGYSQPRDGAHISCTAGRFFNVWAIREAHGVLIFILKGMGIYLRLLRNRKVIDCPFWIYYYNFDIISENSFKVFSSYFQFI